MEPPPFCSFKNFLCFVCRIYNVNLLISKDLEKNGVLVNLFTSVPSFTLVKNSYENEGKKPQSLQVFQLQSKLSFIFVECNFYLLSLNKYILLKFN